MVAPADFFSFAVPADAAPAEPESGISVRVVLLVGLASAAAAACEARAAGVVKAAADEFAAVAEAEASVAAVPDEGRVIASTAGKFCELANCDACSIAWIIIVDISDPAATGVVVVGVPAGFFVASSGVDFPRPPEVGGVLAEVWLVAAASTVVVSEIVSRRGERAFFTVAGATMIIERVTGCCAAGVPLEDVFVAGVVVWGLEVEFELPLGVAPSSSCCCMTSEKLCD